MRPARRRWNAGSRRPIARSAGPPARQPSPCAQGEASPARRVLVEREAGREQQGFRRRRALRGQHGELAVHESGVDIARRELRMGGDSAQQRQVVGDTRDRRAVEVPAQRGDRARAVGAGRDHLGDHRVVVDADRVAVLDAAVDAPGRVFGRAARSARSADRGQEAAARILGVDARLDRVAALRGSRPARAAAARPRRSRAATRPGRAR